MPGIDLITPGDMLALDPAASGVAHGYGLFETIRLRGGALELWEPHWARLTRSAQHLGLPCPFDRAEALESVKTLARALPAEAVIKLSLLKEGTSSRLLVYSRPVLEPPESLGLFLDTPGRIDEGSILAGHKTHNYLENLLVLEAAREQDCFDGLRCNSRGDLAEGAISNLFFLSDGRLHTPSRESGLLPGVVRQALIEVAAVTEGRYTPTCCPPTPFI